MSKKLLLGVAASLIIALSLYVAAAGGFFAQVTSSLSAASSSATVRISSSSFDNDADVAAAAANAAPPLRSLAAGITTEDDAKREDPVLAAMRSKQKRRSKRQTEDDGQNQQQQLADEQQQQQQHILPGNIVSVADIAHILDAWALRHEFVETAKHSKDSSRRIFPLVAGATHEPYQPTTSTTSAASPLLFGCKSPVQTTPNDDVYDGCRLPGINNVLYTQHARWFCLFRDKAASFSMRDRFCNKGTAEKMRYSSILQLRWDHILAPVAAASAATASNKKIRSSSSSVVISPDSVNVAGPLRDARLCKWYPPPQHQQQNQQQQQNELQQQQDPLRCNVWFSDARGHLSTCDEATPLHLCLHVAVAAIAGTGKRAEALAQNLTSGGGVSPSSSPSALPASMCWEDITAKQQSKIPRCSWRDIPSFYFTREFWRARRLIDFHSRYYLAARVAAAVLFPSSSISAAAATSNEQRTLPSYVSVHLRRGDYLHHCVKVKKGSVKEWVTFSKLPVTASSIFQLSSSSVSGSTNHLRFLNQTTRSALQSTAAAVSSANSDPAIPGCYPSLIDIERAFDQLSAATGIRNFFVATNTPHELVKAGIVEPFAVSLDSKNKKENADDVDIFSENAHKPSEQRKRQQNPLYRTHFGKNPAALKRQMFGRKWRAVVLPAGASRLFFQDARGVDDVVLEMAMLSLGRFFLLNRFSSLSANALEMAILRQHVDEDPAKWDNVLTW